MVVRGDLTAESIGKIASLPEDISPLQIGTTLTYANRRYTLLGRYWMGWQDGVWTEWFMDDGVRQGWLAHAQGFFSVAFEHPMVDPLGTAALPFAGAEFVIDDVRFRVTDTKQAQCIASEGELPFAARADLTISYCDMIGAAGRFASLEDSAGQRSLFVGENVDFDRLAFNNLRPLDGWTPPANVAASHAA